MDAVTPPLADYEKPHDPGMMAELLNARLAREALECKKYGQLHMGAFLEERAADALHISAGVLRLHMQIANLRRAARPWWQKVLERYT